MPREVPTGSVILTFTPSAKRKMTEAEEIEDILSFQDLDAFEDDLERLAPQELAIMRGTVVPFSLADAVFDRDDEQSDCASKKDSNL